jgi:hypothetical protein
MAAACITELGPAESIRVGELPVPRPARRTSWSVFDPATVAEAYTSPVAHDLTPQIRMSRPDPAS